jgi:hypothetical protein
MVTIFKMKLFCKQRFDVNFKPSAEASHSMLLLPARGAWQEKKDNYEFHRFSKINVRITIARPGDGASVNGDRWQSLGRSTVRGNPSLVVGDDDPPSLFFF